MQPRPEQLPLAEPLDASSPTHPIVFGDYEIIGKIGQGGMANVYFARSISEREQRLAIKCMRPKIAGEARFVEMFNREAKLALLFEHPSIVRTAAAPTIEGRQCIAMEYIPGQDLHTVIKRAYTQQNGMPIPHAVFIAARIADALNYAHGLAAEGTGRPLHIVNRDVSPANVRLSYDGEVKLLDFGIAQAAVLVSSEIGILKGKFAYMSPEQVRGLPVDPRSDVFSLGIVLHEMLTGERLFREENEFALMERVREALVRPPSEMNTNIPPEIDAIVMQMVARTPIHRPDAAEVQHRLRALSDGYGFRSNELGEFVRRLFATEYGTELASLRSDDAGMGQVAEEGRGEDPTSAPAGPAIRPLEHHEPRAGKPRRSGLLLIAAVLLLTSSLVLIALALALG